MNPFQSKYKVLEKIGDGSFSDVLKCEDRTTKIRYAAKRLKKWYKSETCIKSCAEIVAAKKLSFHPNLVNMLEYHYDSFSGKITLIFELMDISMHDYLKTKRRGLPERKVKGFLHQLLKGLNHLHSHGLFHRDVKPENILIKFPSIVLPSTRNDPNEIIKLADLGSVRGIFSSPPYTEYISTRWYRSPECLLTTGNYGPKMDVWAAGCVFYEMLTLNPLFPGTNEIDQLCKIHQLLGSPSLQFLTHLKSKSRNCIYFPKIKGTGIGSLLPYITNQGRNVFNLMIEYDSEKRSNVKRLLKQSYFDEVANSHEAGIKSVFPNYWYHENLNGINKSMGDDIIVSPAEKSTKKNALKREHYCDEARQNSSDQIQLPNASSKRSSKEEEIRRRSQSNESSKSRKHSSSCKSVQNRKNVSLPVVDCKVVKSPDNAASKANRILRHRNWLRPEHGKILKPTSDQVNTEKNLSHFRRKLYSQSFFFLSKGKEPFSST